MAHSSLPNCHEIPFYHGASRLLPAPWQNGEGSSKLFLPDAAATSFQRRHLISGRKFARVLSLMNRLGYFSHCLEVEMVGGLLILNGLAGRGDCVQ